MKSFIGIVVVAVIMMNGALALPARSPSDDAEVIDVPRKSDDDGFHDFKGVIDTSNYHPFLIPEPHPFSLSLGFFDTFEDIFRRLHNRFWPLDAAGEVGDSDEDGTGIAVNVNGKKGNTTSTVKIVDGHKIEINDTVYGDDNSVFKVRVVNIRPLESGEETGDSDSKGGVAPVTTSPNGSDADQDDHDSEERREPLEEKKPEDNEVKRDIDDQPEIAAAFEVLPTATAAAAAAEAISDETVVANLNVKFVTDNTLENGSAEAETNKSDNVSVETVTTAMTMTTMSPQDSEDSEETALATAELELNDGEDRPSSSSSSRSVHNEALTVEDDGNNEDSTEPDTADNFNESNDGKASEQLQNREQVVAETDAPAVLDGDELTAELSEDIDKDIDAVKEKFDFESISITHKKQNDNDDDDEDEDGEKKNDEGTDYDDDDDDDGDSINHETKKSNMDRLKYTTSKLRQREDVSSSDDDADDADDATARQPFEMNAQFNAEWAALGNREDEDFREANDLSNDIEIYDSVAPYDLLNDLVVNDVAASNPNFPLNPDAEFIDVSIGSDAGVAAGVNGALMSASMKPKFEKLSLGPSAADSMNFHNHSAAAQHSSNLK